MRAKKNVENNNNMHRKDSAAASWAEAETRFWGGLDGVLMYFYFSEVGNNKQE